MAACRGHKVALMESAQISSVESARLTSERVRILLASVPESIPVNLFSPSNSDRSAVADVARPRAWLIDYEARAEAAMTKEDVKREQKTSERVEDSPMVGWGIMSGVLLVGVVCSLIIAKKMGAM